MRAEIQLHSFDGLGINLRNRAAPTGMGCAYCSIDRIVKNSSLAIGMFNQKPDIFLICDQSIACRLVSWDFFYEINVIAVALIALN